MWHAAHNDDEKTETWDQLLSEDEIKTALKHHKAAGPGDLIKKTKQKSSEQYLETAESAVERKFTCIHYSHN